MTFSSRQHRVLLVLACVAAALFVSFALQSLHELGWRVAHAQTSADPLATASSATDAGFALVQQYGPIWGGMLLIYGFASSLLAKAQSKHWIAQGRTLAMLVAGVGIFGSVLTTHFAGGQWQGVAITAVLAVFKLVNPVAVPSSTPARSAAAGFISVRLMAILMVAGAAIGVVVLESCAKTEATIKDTATCMESDAVKALTPTVEAVILTGGTLWDKVLAALAANPELGPDLVDCAVKAAKADLLAKLGAAPGNADAVKRADQWLGRHKSSALEPAAGGGLTIMDASNAAALGADAVPCEPRNYMPVVSCEGGVMSYDGCRWSCAPDPLAGATFEPVPAVHHQMGSAGSL